MKTSELTGIALDWAVATANGDYPQWDAEWGVFYAANGDDMDYSTNWAQGGPIIERECIDLQYQGGDTDVWAADIFGAESMIYGDTALIAAMRCFVASKLGDEIDVPDEFKEREHD